MELTDLAVFQAVARSGGVTQAASRLNKVQSGVSARLRRLEQELGTELFRRQSRRMYLTAGGRSLLEYADKILLLADEARARLSGDVPTGPLRLGAMESTSASRLPKLLSEYHSQFPEVALKLSTGTTEDLLRDVAEYRLDAAFVSEPVTAAGIERLKVYQEELVLVAAVGQPLISNPEDLEGQALLVFKSGCAYRKRLEDWVGGARTIAGRRLELSSYQTMLGCAASGMGVAIMPRSVTDILPGTSGVSVHALPPELALAETSLIWKKDNETSAILALIKMLRETQKRP